MNDNLQYQNVLHSLINSTALEIDAYASLSATLCLPSISKELIIQLNTDVSKLFRESPVMLTIKSPCVVVGDLHGHILDFLRILKTFGLPSQTQYLLLGDLVDRGEFSIETVVLAFLLKVLFNENFHIIRGNHEFEFLCTQCGFSSQLESEYGPDLIDTFITTFSYLPLAALIDQKILCVHGGIGPSVFSMQQISRIERPIHDFLDDFMNSLLWSDPSDETKQFEPSARGTGYLFGQNAVNEFVYQNDLKCIIRAHECVMNGVEYHFDKKCITVFSASNYCGLMNNKSAVLKIKGPNNIEEVQFPPLQYLKREAVVFRSHRGPAPRRKVTLSYNSSFDSIKTLHKVTAGQRNEKLPHLNQAPIVIRRERQAQSPIASPIVIPKSESLKKQATLPSFKVARRGS